MNKAKEWIEELQSNPDWSTTYIDWEAVDEIEDALKVLGIIRRIIKYDVEVNHNCDIPKYEKNEVISKKEYDFLKKMLL